MLQHAWALLEVKAADPERRTITGIATTPTLDRSGHIYETAGATFTNPVPLLLHHDRERPIGTATLAKRGDAITFEASLPAVPDPGPLRDRIEDTWQTLKAGLMRGASIGFRATGDGIEFIKGGGIRITKSEICELSLVTIPANRDASILTIKALDQAAMGLHSPGVAGLPVVRADKAALPMTTAEQITQWTTTRAPKAARMTALMDEAAKTGVTLDAKAAEEYDTLKGDIQGIDAHLLRLKDVEALQLTQAQPVVQPASFAAAPGLPSPMPVIQVKSLLPKGTAFVRFVCAQLVCHGNKFEAAEYAKRWNDSTPEVALAIKAAVAPGNTTDATWASPLVNQNISSDFIELLRPATILGKIPGLRTIPFNTKVPSQTAGGTYGWVGEAKPKPITKLAFAPVTLDIAKAAGIIVLTEELVRLSNPSAEDLVRRDMIAGIAQFLDSQFIDPAVAAVPGVNPASITNGAPTTAATANPLTDLLGLIAHFATNNISVEGLTLIMSPGNALAWSFYTAGSSGDKLFPGLGMGGGSVQGINVVTSQAAGTNVIALQPALILYADDGQVSIDASREASLQMDSAPDAPPLATTVMVSLWQNNLVGLRAERFVNWKRAITNAVKYLTAAAYPAPAGIATPSTPPE